MQGLILLVCASDPFRRAGLAMSKEVNGPVQVVMAAQWRSSSPDGTCYSERFDMRQLAKVADNVVALLVRQLLTWSLTASS